jgi:hypothetical protein
MNLAVSEEHIGQPGKCSRCGTVFPIQTPQSAQAQPVINSPRIQPRPGDPDVQLGAIRVAAGIAEGFNLLHANLGNFILMSLCFLGIVILVSVFSAIPCVGFLIAISAGLVIYPGLMAGFYRACLKQHDGGQAEVGDLFAEFDQWLEYILLFLIQIVIAFAVWIPGSVLILLSLIPTAQGNQPVIPLLILGIVVLILCMILSALALVFVLPALVDRRRGIGDAISTSWRLMISNPIGLLGAVLLASLMGMLGTLLCCVGTIYTIPATFCMVAAIYRTSVPSSRLVQVPVVDANVANAAPIFPPPMPPGSSPP